MSSGWCWAETDRAGRTHADEAECTGEGIKAAPGPWAPSEEREMLWRWQQLQWWESSMESTVPMGGIEGGGSKLLDLFQCLYTVQIYCRNTNRSKQTSPVFIYTHKIHTHTHTRTKWFICISACVQEDSHLHHTVCSEVRRDTPGWHHLHRHKPTNKQTWPSVSVGNKLNSACVHQISFPAFPVNGRDW